MENSAHEKSDDNIFIEDIDKLTLYTKNLYKLYDDIVEMNLEATERIVEISKILEILESIDATLEKEISKLNENNYV